MRKILVSVICVLACLLILAAGLVLVLTVREYRPAPVEECMVPAGGRTLAAGEELTVLSWNIGYGGLGAESDFFMDGGKEVRAADEETVLRYLSGISGTVGSAGADALLLQEVDTDSSRSYGIDEAETLAGALPYVHALNYSCDFVPYPLPPIGKVHSGLMTAGELSMESAERIALPCPFSWPVSAANLKRCLLVSWVPIQGSDAQLTLVNLHLEAYDDGEGKRAQTEQLRSFIQSEYEKGNYVIAGGDFNQVFPGSLEAYPNSHPELWEPGVLEDSLLPEGWQMACDLSVPSCRLLNQPYDPEDTADTQYYVIDGFLLSPNVELLSVKTMDLGFENSDHNPVRLQVKLG